MTQQFLNTGVVSNDATGTTLQTGGQIINANFTELYGNTANIPLITAVIVNGLVAGNPATAAANTIAIQNALTTGGDVWVTVAGTIYTNAPLVYGSNSRLILGQNTTIRQAPGTNSTLLMSSSLVAFNAGGKSVTLSQSGSFNTVKVNWPAHGFTRGQGVWLYGMPTMFATESLSGVAITGTAGQFSCTASTLPLKVGQMLMISGFYGGGGSITGYANPSYYLISVTNGSTTFTLTNMDGTAIVTTSGTPTGLTYTQWVMAGGSGYTTPGTYNGVALTTGGSGTGATANVTIASGAVSAIQIVKSGAGYANGDSLSFADASVGGRTGGTAFSASATVLIQNPYNGCFRIVDIVDANNFTILTNYFGTTPPFGTSFGVAAVQSFHLEGGTWDYDFANNSGAPSPSYRDHTINFIGAIDCSIKRAIVIRGNVFNVLVDAVNNFTYENLRGADDPASDCDGMKIYGPSFNVYGNGLTGSFHGAAELISLQSKEPPNFIDYHIGGGGDLINIHLRGLSSVVYSASGGGDVHVYPSDAEVIDNITIEDVVLSAAQINLWSLSPYTKAYIRGIRLSNITAIGASSANQGCIVIGGAGGASAATIDNLVVEKSSFNPCSAASTQNIVFVAFAASAKVQSCLVDACVMNGMPYTQGNMNGVLLSASSSVDNLTIRSCTSRNQGTGNLVWVAGSTGYATSNVKFDNCRVDVNATQLFASQGAPAATVNLFFSKCLTDNPVIFNAASTGTFNVNIDNNVFNNANQGVVRFNSTATVNIRSSGTNQFTGTTNLVQGVAGSPVLSLKGFDLSINPFTATSTLPGGNGTLSTAAGQSCNSTSAGANMAGLAVSTTSANPWWALATNAGANVNITS